jgi:hypothetical protein
LALGSKSSVGGQTVRDVYDGLNSSQKRGFIRLLTPIVGNKNPGDYKFFAGDLGRIIEVLKNQSGYPNKTLKEFLDDVDELGRIGKELGDDGVKAVDDMLLGLVTKKASNGNVGYRMNNIKGTAAEVVEIVTLKKAGVNILEIQPLDGTTKRMFREAECGGGYKNVQGDFFLEVKNYPFFKQQDAVNSLVSQNKTHFARSPSRAFGSGSTDINDWHGLVYRFSKAGPDNKNIDVFREKLIDSTKDSVRKKLEELGVEPGTKEMADKVKEFIENKLIIDLVEP